MQINISKPKNQKSVIGEIFRKISRKNGIVALSVTLLLSAVITEIAIIGAIIAYALTNANYSIRLASEALASARAGISDGLIRIMRDKNWSSAGYNLPVGLGGADIVVCKDARSGGGVCDVPDIGKREITAIGRAFTKSQTLRAVIDVDSLTGEARVVEILEI